MQSQLDSTVFPPSKDPAEFREIAARLIAAQNALQEQGREARLAAAGASAPAPPTLLPPAQAAVPLVEAEAPWIEVLVKRQLAAMSQNDLENATATDDAQFQKILATAEPPELRQLAEDKGWTILSRDTRLWVPEYRNQLRAVLSSFPKRARNILSGASNRVSARPPPASAPPPPSFPAAALNKFWSLADTSETGSDATSVTDLATDPSGLVSADPATAAASSSMPKMPSDLEIAMLKSNAAIDAKAAELGIPIPAYKKDKVKVEDRKLFLLNAVREMRAGLPADLGSIAESSTGMGVGRKGARGLPRHGAYVVGADGTFGALKGVDVRRLAVEHVLWVAGKRASAKLDPQVAADLVALLSKRTQRRAFAPQAVQIFADLVAKSGLPARHGSFKWALVSPETARKRVGVVAGEAQAVPQMIERAALLMSAVAAGNTSIEVRDELARLLHALHRAGAMSKSALIENMTKIL